MFGIGEEHNKQFIHCDPQEWCEPLMMVWTKPKHRRKKEGIGIY